MTQIVIKYRGHDIRREPTMYGNYAIYESGDTDNTLLWTGDTVASCRSMIDDVLDDAMDGDNQEVRS